jgi:hypothetical protein
VGAYACNPSYSGSRGRKTLSLKQSQAKVIKTLSQKPNTGPGGGEKHGSSGRVPAQPVGGNSSPFRLHPTLEGLCVHAACL